jgi:hypothetical protein
MRSWLQVFSVVAAALALGLWRTSAAPIQAGTALRLSLDDLVQRSDVIVEAEVIGATAREDALGRIETELVLSVSRTFLGEPLATRSVRVPGGTLPDGRGLLLAGMPRIEVGETSVLFLSAPSRQGLRLPIGLGQGRLAVVRGPRGEKLLERDVAGLSIVDPASGAVQPAGAAQTEDYATAIARIEAAVLARRAMDERRAGGG